MLGFTRVYRYTAGKADWLANGWPVEGDQAKTPTAGSLARRDVPTCHLGERVCEVHAGIQGVGWDICVVVSDEGVVVGLLRGEAFNTGSETLVEQVMECAPRTYRLDAPPEKALDYMQRNKLDSVLVTTSDGKLVGALKREDIG